MSAGHIIGGPADPDYHGAVLTADLAIGDTVLHVDDVADFDEDASKRDAKILLGVDSTAEGAPDAANATSLAYLTCDDDASTVTLSAASTVVAVTGDRVYVADPVSGLPVVDYVVMVAHDDGDTTGDALPVTLTHAIAATVGNLSDLDGQSITFEEDDDGELIASDLPGLDASAGSVKAYQDSLTVTALGDQTLTLTYKPLPNTSVHLYWNGVFQPDSEWTRDGWDLTIPDGAAYIEVGDVLVAKYLYTDPALKASSVTVTVDVPATEITSAPGSGTAWTNDSLSAEDATTPFIGPTLIDAAEWVSFSQLYTVIGKYGTGPKKFNLDLPVGSVVTAMSYVVKAYRESSFPSIVGDATTTAATSAFGSIPASLPAMLAASDSRTETPYFPDIAVATVWSDAYEVQVDEPDFNAVLIDDHPFDKFTSVQQDGNEATVKWDYLAIRVTYTTAG